MYWEQEKIMEKKNVLKFINWNLWLIVLYSGVNGDEYLKEDKSGYKWGYQFVWKEVDKSKGRKEEKLQ